MVVGSEEAVSMAFRSGIKVIARVGSEARNEAIRRKHPEVQESATSLPPISIFTILDLSVCGAPVKA